MSGFLDDIRAQGAALRDLAQHADETARAIARIDLESFDRIVLSGMGGSHYAAYPAWLQLVGRGAPVWWVETSELLHHAPGLLDGRTLLWLTSQSGESVEVVELLRSLPDERRPTVVGLTNTPSSTLARTADHVVELHAGAEQAVSTRTYVNTLGAFALALAAPAVGPVAKTLEQTAATLEAWLVSLDDELNRAGELLVGCGTLIITGRGQSLAAARSGALTIKEAAKAPAEALSAGELRHGPIELAGSDLTVVILAGESRTAALNRTLAADLVGFGAKALWIGDAPPEGVPSLPSPPADGDLARTISEIVSLQLCSVALARFRGIEPGVFRFASKVTIVQ